MKAITVVCLILTVAACSNRHEGSGSTPKQDAVYSVPSTPPAATTKHQDDVYSVTSKS